MENLQAIKQRFEIIGNDPTLNRSLEKAIQVAPTDISVLVTGESGVGKESIPKIIHGLSHRKHSKYIAVNCGAIPEGTIDSELFGHEKGAFTGATATRSGYFEVADGGTIFLDEVGELPLTTQVRLLRVLENGEFLKVGSSQVQKTNVRIVAATNVEMTKAIQEGKFREDLFYRLSTVPIYVPPLRERGGDIELLFRKFTTDFSESHRVKPISLTNEAKNLLQKQRFPGNIRQLKNLAEQISVLEKERNINAAGIRPYLPDRESQLPALIDKKESKSDFSSEREILYKLFFDMKKDVTELKRLFLDMIQNPELAAQHPQFIHELQNMGGSLDGGSITLSGPIVSPAASPISMPASSSLDAHVEVEESLNILDKERELILKALKKHKSKRKDAAADLGISERTLYRKLKEYNIEE